MNPLACHLVSELLSTESDPPRTDLELLRASRSAMATQFEVVLPIGQPKCFAAANAVLDLIDELEDQLTVYRETSEISRLNMRAPFEDIPVETRLFDLLVFAAYLTHETGGAFDIATGSLIKCWGFYQRSGRVPSVAERVEAMGRLGMRHVVLNSKNRTVRYLRNGLEINLGGIGKGYALDRAAELLVNEWGMRSGLLQGGTSSVRAIGTAPGQAGWLVSLKHPWDSNRLIGELCIRDQGLGTSAATFQHFEYNGRKLGHLLDPRQGWPAEGVQQVSVLAPTAAEADALSTAFFVMGLEATRQWCQTHPHVGAVILVDEVQAPVVLNLAPGTFTPA
ncbi:MAG: FAD:protein FMN transferase [Planctomycetes bacterium]|nr:FAD:protein FMN transferase [Planctomycetota bacterium]